MVGGEGVIVMGHLVYNKLISKKTLTYRLITDSTTTKIVRILNIFAWLFLVGNIDMKRDSFALQVMDFATPAFLKQNFQCYGRKINYSRSSSVSCRTTHTYIILVNL